MSQRAEAGSPGTVWCYAASVSNSWPCTRMAPTFADPASCSAHPPFQVIATLRRGEDYVEAFENVTVLFSGEARRAEGPGTMPCALTAPTTVLPDTMPFPGLPCCRADIVSYTTMASEMEPLQVGVLDPVMVWAVRQQLRWHRTSWLQYHQPRPSLSPISRLLSLVQWCCSGMSGREARSTSLLAYVHALHCRTGGAPAQSDVLRVRRVGGRLRLLQGGDHWRR